MRGKGRGKSTVICPFYKRDRDSRILCEGWEKQQNIQLNFESVTRKIEYMANFCETRCWQGCAVASFNMEQQEGIQN